MFVIIIIITIIIIIIKVALDLQGSRRCRAASRGPAAEPGRGASPPSSGGGLRFGRAMLCATTAQRGWCMEAFVPMLDHSQSLKWFPGGGGVHRIPLPGPTAPVVRLARPLAEGLPEHS